MTHFTHKLLKYLSRLDRNELEHIVQELDQNLDQRDQVLNNAPFGMLTANTLKKIVLANETFLRLFSFKKEELLGFSIVKILDSFDFNSPDLVQTLFNEKQTLSFDFQQEKTNPLWIRFHAVPILNPQNELNSVVFFFIDITDLKQLDEKRAFIEKWNTLIPLAAGLAHEIGNPLNALDIHLQLALREIKQLPFMQREKLHKCLSVAKEEIDRLDRIVNHFLSAVRPLKGNLKLKEINQILDSALDFMAPEALQHHVEIERRFQTNLPELLIDEDQLKQAFINLIKNAIQAMPEGGLLKVRTERLDKNISIQFKDTGKGIKSEEIPHIFEPYYTTKEKGSGLGLVAVKRIINNHGGIIRVENKTKKGAHFNILLPIDRANRPLLTKGESNG